MDEKEKKQKLTDDEIRGFLQAMRNATFFLIRSQGVAKNVPDVELQNIIAMATGSAHSAFSAISTEQFAEITAWVDAEIQRHADEIKEHFKRAHDNARKASMN